MTAAQKTAQANFKKAIAYRKKTGCSLKQAFAHVKGGKVTGLEKVVKDDNKRYIPGSTHQRYSTEIKINDDWYKISNASIRRNDIDFTKFYIYENKYLVPINPKSHKIVYKISEPLISKKTLAKDTTKKMSGINNIMTAGKNLLLEKLGKLEAKKFVTPTKAAKRKIQKEITHTKTQLRKFLK